MLKKLKEHPSVVSRATDLILMLPSNDPMFREAVNELGFGQILQKPFSRELLMWTLRPFLFKASGAPDGIKIPHDLLRKDLFILSFKVPLKIIG